MGSDKIEREESGISGRFPGRAAARTAATSARRAGVFTRHYASPRRLDRRQLRLKNAARHEKLISLFRTAERRSVVVRRGVALFYKLCQFFIKSNVDFY